MRDPLMEQKLLEWYRGLNGEKFQLKLLLKKHWNYRIFLLLKHLRDGFKSLEKEIILS